MAQDDLDTQRQLKQFVRERSYIKARLTRLEKHLNQELHMQESLAVHEENLVKIRADFDSVQKRILYLVSDDGVEKEEDEMEKFEERCSSAAIKLKTLVNAIKQKSTQEESTDIHTLAKILKDMSTPTHKEAVMYPRVKLPDLPMPKFSGKYSEWASFRDIFQCNVHNNPTLNNMQKLQVLKGLLLDSAKSVVQHLLVTDANYEEVWRLLEERFDKKQHSVEELIQLFMSQPTLTKQESTALRKMYDTAREVVNGLNALNCVERDAWLVHIYLSKMDMKTKTLWARESCKGSEVPTFDTFLEFLDHQCSSLESIQLKPGFSSQQNQPSAADPAAKGAKPKQTITKSQNQKSFAIREQQPTFVCKICTQTGHQVFHCPTFIAASAQKRLQLVQGAHLCTNCLKPSHTAEVCNGSKCRQCHMTHNTMLHGAFSAPQHADDKQTAPAEKPPTHPKTTVTATTQTVDKSRPNMVLASMQGNSPENRPSEILLPTISLLVMGADRRFYRCRTFYDSCSQPNLITKRFAEKAFLQIHTSALPPLKGVTPQSMTVQHTVTVEIFTTDKEFIQTVTFVVVDEIADMHPTVCLDLNMLIPPNIKLADPEFNNPGRVDMLIGAQLFWKTLRQGNFGNSPEFRETAFGYVVSGSVPTNSNMDTSGNVCFLTTQTDQLANQLEKFWTIEEAEQPHKVLSAEEKQCEEHFVKHTTRDEHGRFIVRLSTRDNLQSIGDTRQVALRRFLAMEKKLQRDPALQEKYVGFMQEYERLGHMRPAPESYTSSRPEIYLPHHAVVKTSSKTTPVRVVFDASAKSSTHISLNDTLMVGPKTQEDLFQILLRFRQHAVAIKADIRKMFRQVRVHEDDQSMQRILWRDSPTQTITTYLLTTITYGTASASYLSTRCMQQLAQDDGDDFPLAKEAAARDFYVDDLLSGHDSVADAKELCAQADQLMKQGGFELTKWMSSHPEAIEQFPQEEHELGPSLGLGPDDTIKALGLIYCPAGDYFTFTAVQCNSKVTKRTILSEISKIYDPLGLLTPIVVKAKMLMQALWKLKVDWDDEIEDSDILLAWAEHQQSIRDIHHITIPRRVTTHIQAQTTELLAFSDASSDGYAACIYLRTVTADGEESCRLLCAKSRVAPLKQVTIPRLELCGAILAVQLIQVVKQSLTLNIDSIRAYTDSMVVLHWLAAENPRKWKTFVANRVSEIQRILPRKYWDHVRSELNPADIASRGATARELANHALWWNGPDLSQCGLREASDQLPEDGVELEQKIFLTIQDNDDFWEVITRFSRFSKLIRVLAYCRRYIHNKFLTRRQNFERITGPLTVDELKSTTHQVVRVAQQQSFPEDIHYLRKDKEVPRTSRIKSLAPFLDKEGILRVGGRIHKANLGFDQKHQILLQDKHHLTNLIAEKFHKDNLHGGHQLILSSMRQEFWPIRGLDVVKRAARRCIPCFKCKPQLSQQLMGNLPAARIQYTQPFSRVGVDFCGPFMIKPPLRRSAIVKVYVAVFVCFVTRAVHLEMVHDLTSEAFIACLRRFCGRRGKPSDIFCDNAKNFVGAANHLREIHNLLQNAQTRDSINTHTSQQGSKFHFIPPRSPHFGGIWESAVKSFKLHFKRVAGNTVFTLETLETVITEIEACLNSRPLCAMTSDPSDLTALTPGHFITGAALNTMPAQDLTQIQQNRLTKWRLNEQILQHFWKRWHREILTSMQQRKKWQHDRPNIQKGDLVTIQEDNTPPLKWHLGRVIDIHPGEDNKVRVATVQTQDGVYKRAIQRLAVLPKEEEEEETSERTVQRGQYVTARYNGANV